MTIAMEELAWSGIAFESDYATSLFLPVGGNSNENERDKTRKSMT